MKSIKTLSILVCVALALAFASCGTKAPKAEEVVNEVEAVAGEAIESVETVIDSVVAQVDSVATDIANAVEAAQ